MGFTWKDFRRGMELELSTARHINSFEKAKSARPCLQRFDSPEHLVEWLLDYGSHSTGEEDDVIRSLRELHAAGPSPTLWLAILALGLWPTMEWVFCHVRKSFVSDAEAASAIWDSLCDRLGYEPLWSEAGIAKRLMIAVWTKARRSALKEIKARSGTVSFDTLFQLADSVADDIESDDGEIAQPKRPAFREPIQLPTTDCFDASLDDLKTRLVRDAGLSTPDAALLVNHIVFGKTLSEMAAEEGVSPAAFRQRFHRAKDRLRKAAEKISPSAVTFSIPDDLGIQRGNQAPAKPNVNGRVA